MQHEDAEIGSLHTAHLGQNPERDAGQDLSRRAGQEPEEDPDHGPAQGPRQGSGKGLGQGSGLQSTEHSPIGGAQAKAVQAQRGKDAFNQSPLSANHSGNLNEVLSTEHGGGDNIADNSDFPNHSQYGYGLPDRSYDPDTGDGSADTTDTKTIQQAPVPEFPESVDRDAGPVDHTVNESRGQVGGRDNSASLANLANTVSSLPGHTDHEPDRDPASDRDSNSGRLTDRPLQTSAGPNLEQDPDLEPTEATEPIARIREPNTFPDSGQEAGLFRPGLSRPDLRESTTASLRLKTPGHANFAASEISGPKIPEPGELNEDPVSENARLETASGSTPRDTNLDSHTSCGPVFSAPGSADPQKDWQGMDGQEMDEQEKAPQPAAPQGVVDRWNFAPPADADAETAQPQVQVQFTHPTPDRKEPWAAHHAEDRTSENRNFSTVPSSVDSSWPTQELVEADRAQRQRLNGLDQEGDKGQQGSKQEHTLASISGTVPTPSSDLVDALGMEHELDLDDLDDLDDLVDADLDAELDADLDGDLDDADNTDDAANTGSPDTCDTSDTSDTSDQSWGALSSEPPVRRSKARTLRTENQYAVYVRSMYNSSIRLRTVDPQQPPVVTPLQVVRDLVGSMNGYAPSTWKLYRSALLWHMATHRNDNELYEEAYQLIAGSLAASRRPDLLNENQGANPDANANSGADATKTTKPSTKKTISEIDLNKLINQLCGMNRITNWGSRTQFWLLAGLACGARPSEWVGASWLDDSQTILCIPNSKRKMTVPIWQLIGPGQTIHDVEANHPERLLRGSLFDPSKQTRNVAIASEDKLWVNLHLGALNDYLNKSPQFEVDQAYIRYYNMCRKVLRKACLIAFEKKQYPLYVMRSQYAANLKAELPLEEVAARMGHEPSGRTTMSSYGPRTSAHGGRGAPTPAQQQAKAQARQERTQKNLDKNAATDASLGTDGFSQNF